MQHTHILKACCLVLAALLGAACVAPAFAAGPEQELKTLKLVRTYQSEAEFQAAHAKLLREKHPIAEDGEFIKFFDPQTGQLLKQMKKGTQFHQIQITDVEKMRLSHPSHPEAVTKECMGYYLPPQAPSFLLVFEYAMTFPLSDEASVSEKIQHATVYNQRGEKVIDLPSDANMFAPSPNQTYFIVYYEGIEGVGEYLYFYHADGTLINKQQFSHTSLKINYSSTGEFIAIHNRWGKQFNIFTKHGEVVFEGNYQEYAGKNSMLEDVFVSDDGNYILLSVSNKAILLNQNGSTLWEIPVSGTPIRSVHFQFDKERLYLSTIQPNILYHNPARQPDVILVTALKSGELLDEMTHIVYYTIANNILYIKYRQGDYYEYAIE